MISGFQQSRRALGVLLLLAGLVACQSEPESRIDEIRERGYLNCGVLPAVDGFASVNDGGDYAGFEIDLCRAVAAAILGDDGEVRYAVVRTIDRFEAQDDIDIVARRLTWTMQREVEHDLLFSPVVFYDGAAALVPESSGIENIRQLDGQPVCAHGGSEAYRALIHRFEADALALEVRAAGDFEAAAADFFADRCVALVADLSELAAARASRDVSGFRILPEQLSKEPLSILVRRHHAELALAVKWTVLLLIAAEEAGLTTANVDAPPAAADWVSYPAEPLRLDPHWATAVIRSVGNYGEIYARNLGEGSPLRLERGLNDLWTRGGLLYAPPIR